MTSNIRYAINYDRGAVIEWKADGTRVHKYDGEACWRNDHGDVVDHKPQQETTR